MTRVLIIDDDPDVRMVMNSLLKNKGYEVDSAAGREDAMEKLDEFKPSVVLLDVLLSGSDGRSICKEIKANTNTKDIRVIMVSAHPGAADNISSYGADDFIAKPFNTDALITKIEGLVNERK